MTLEEKLKVAVKNLAITEGITLENTGDDAYCYRLFIEIFNQVPNVMYFFDCPEKESSLLGFDDFDSLLEEDDISSSNEIDLVKTTKNVLEKFNCYVYKWKTYKLILSDTFLIFRGVIFNTESTRSKELTECAVKIENENANLKFVSVDNNGSFNVQYLPINESVVDVNTNYNDDIPYNRMEEIIKAKESSLMLFYGDPGCGKSFLLRKLIKENPDISFYWLDSSMFSQINSTAFMEFLFQCKNSVFILEDCEIVLKDRTTNYNTLITPILNISDGMLGDSLKLKFICTFNSELQNVDPALLRKGRLKLKYEFKPLNKDKAQTLSDKLGNKVKITKDTPLCDIYNNEDNGVKETKKIGF